MEFNNFYLKQLENETEQKLAKLLIFCVREEIPIFSFMKNEENLTLSEAFQDAANRLLSSMYRSSVIGIDYSNHNGRVTLPQEIYVTTNTINEDFDIQLFRNNWSYSVLGEKGKMGDKTIIRNQIVEYLKQHPEHTYEQICKAASNYIGHCLASGRFIKDADNFIDSSEGKSLLNVWIEEEEEEQNNLV